MEKCILSYDDNEWNCLCSRPTLHVEETVVNGGFYLTGRSHWDDVAVEGMDLKELPENLAELWLGFEDRSFVLSKPQVVEDKIRFDNLQMVIE